eukprot:scaffold42043_cov73-Attheya_sp.AAC.3
MERKIWLELGGICVYKSFGEKYPIMSVELNRCMFNNMTNDPRMEKPDPNTGRHPACMTLQDECQEDCHETSITEIRLAHFTICGKPWKCESDSEDFEAWKSPLLHNGTKDITDGPPISGILPQGRGYMI